ncbi:MAG: panE [Hyphomicrobiales bacterium]|nr:panE [Hyphomicrobiales bacterium]
MRICIVGAGAIGGMLAVRLADSGSNVSVVARGAQLAAIRERGLTLIEADDSRRHAFLNADRNIAALGPQDVIILAVKAHQLADACAGVADALAPEGVIVTAQNGVPWWYFEKLAGPWAGRRVESVDPHGRIAAALPIDRVMGAVVYPAAEIEAPGVIRHIEGLRFSIGELDGVASARATRVSDALRTAGFKAPVISDIRSEIWTKLWGNLAFNPISALTRATLAQICANPDTRELAANMMREAQAVAEKLGVRFRIPLEKRLQGAAEVGEHKTSMLQDLEAGREMEVGALVAAVAEIGRWTDTPTPHIDSVLACVRLLGQAPASAVPV